jgi:valyl-tRNA synthetase
VARSLEEAKEKAQEELKVDKSEISFHQDVDVLETWLSSDLLYSEFDRPNQTQYLQLFYPTILLETGHDTIFFWVARMVFFKNRSENHRSIKENVEILGKCHCADGYYRSDCF